MEPPVQNEKFILEYCLGIANKHEILTWKGPLSKKDICKIMNEMLGGKGREIKKEFGFQDPLNEPIIHLIRLTKEDKNLRESDIKEKFIFDKKEGPSNFRKVRIYVLDLYESKLNFFYLWNWDFLIEKNKNKLDLLSQTEAYLTYLEQSTTHRHEIKREPLKLEFEVTINDKKTLLFVLEKEMYLSWSFMKTQVEARVGISFKIAVRYKIENALGWVDIDQLLKPATELDAQIDAKYLSDFGNTVTIQVQKNMSKV